MKRLISGLVTLGLLVGVHARAAAQERTPAAGSAAIGIDVGAFVPPAAELNNSLLLNVLYEYYVTPRVSLRTDVGWASPSFNSGGVSSLRTVPVRLDLNYNWEGRRWHPFVGTGAGVYFMQFRSNQQVFGDTEHKLGFNLGGGLEYFVHRQVSLKGEGRYHFIEDTRGHDPSGLAITAGLKTYF